MDQMSLKWLNKTTKASFWSDIDSEEVRFDTSDICYEDSEREKIVSCRGFAFWHTLTQKVAEPQ
jgi:hypothetical protein